MKIYGSLLFLFALIATTATADEWPQFRGPDGNGHSSAANVPISWSGTENVRWKTALPEGWSSPILVKGRLYLTAAQAMTAGEKPDLSFRTYCVDAQTGEKIWDKEVFSAKGAQAPRIHKKNSHATPTPVFDDGKIYVHFGHQGTAALDVSGNILWKNNKLDYPPVHGQGCSPIIIGDNLFFSCDGKSNPFVISLDKKTGKERWRTKRTTSPSKTFSFCSPITIEVNGKTQIISPGSGAVFAYDPQNGKELWTADYGEGYSVVPKPVYAHGLIFVSSGFDRPVLMAIKPGGEVAWKTDRGAPLTPSMLVIGDELYFLSDAGIMSCVDAKTGKLHWKERTCGAISASPFYADGRIYVQDEAGVGVVLKPGKTFEKLAENDLGERTLASSIPTDGGLFIRSNKHLFRIGK